MLKQIYILILLTTFLVGVTTLAGTFSPTPVTPGASDYTLSDIYNKISSSTYSYSSHTFAPATTPNSTYLTLTEIWDIIPPFKTLISGDLSTGILPAGIYNAVTDLATIEPNLIPENIALGTTIFGVEGSYEASGCDATCQALRNGLVAYYPLDTDTDDYSGNGLNGTNSGATQTSGIIGGGYEFSGTSFVDIANPVDFSGQIFSVSTWINTTDPGGNIQYREIISNISTSETGTFDFGIMDGISYSSNSNGGFFMGWESGHDTFSASDYSLDLRDGNWHNVVGTYERGSQKYYVDGELRSTSSYSGDLSISSQSTHIGGTGWHGYHPRWIGKIDEVALYNRALSESEVLDLYNGGSGRSLINN